MRPPGHQARTRHSDISSWPMKNDNFKYVFVCGLHRSGTTALARDIAKFKDCTALANTGVTMDEGEHLQDVYPRDYTCGGPGRFGFNPATHLTEASPLLTPANAAKILRSWEPYWDSSKTIRIEKTPGNLLMTRFLQAAFPPAYFVVIQRHPVAVSLATQKWSAGARPHNLFDHWLWCHKLFDEDKKHLARVYEIRYEDYVQDPGKSLREIAAFMGTEPSPSQENQADGSHNSRYLTQWHDKLQKSPLRIYYRSVARVYEKRFEPYGYSVVDPLRQGTDRPRKSSLASRAIAELLCFVLDACTYTRRHWAWPNHRTVRPFARLWNASRQAKPGPV